MSAGEEEFVRKRIYLPLERGRDIALRNLFRKVFIAGGFEEAKDGQSPIRRTRIPVTEFAAALRIGTHADARTRVDIDEVECLLSNLIYKVCYSTLGRLGSPLTYQLGSYEGLYRSRAWHDRPQ